MMKKHCLWKKAVTFGITLFFVATCILTSTAQTTQDTSPSPLKGTWLYVGGAGPGNYSTIQSALDASHNGDTVFVYDDSSPYQENLLVNSSVSLIGEQKATTIVDGMNHKDTINITANNVTITGFSVINGNDSGIIINSNGSLITDNIITDNVYGIVTSFGQMFGTAFSHNTITHNDISDNGAAITFFSGNNITIADNTLMDNEQAMALQAVSDSNVSRNTISENEIGIWLLVAYRTLIAHNNFSHNSDVGLATLVTSASQILQNNFIGNNRSALVYEFPWTKLRLHVPLHRNVWRQNYWDEPRILPYMVHGVFLNITFQIDWLPAHKPYQM